MPMTEPPTTTPCGDCPATTHLDAVSPGVPGYVPHADYLCESCGLAQKAVYNHSGPYWDRAPGWWWLGQGNTGRVVAAPECPASIGPR